MDVYQVFWLITITIFVIAELATSALVTIWFASGAVVSFLSSLFNISFYWQFIIFVISSAILLIGFFPFVKKRLGAKTYDTNVDSLIGKEAIITEKVEINLVGKAKIGGMTWSVAGLNIEEEIPIGTRVKIEEVSGNKLIVSKL